MLLRLVSFLVLSILLQFRPAFGGEKVDMKAIYEEAKKFSLDKEKERKAIIAESLKDAAKENITAEDHESCQARPYLGEGEGESQEGGGCGQKMSPKESTSESEMSPRQSDQAERSENISKKNKNETIYVFVSLSMPKESLKQLLQDAKQYNAVLLLRGLKNNSFRETAAWMQSLGKDVQEGMEINPELFETYQIKQVPVFVLVKEDKEVRRLSGNVSLAFASEKLREVR